MSKFEGKYGGAGAQSSSTPKNDPNAPKKFGLQMDKPVAFTCWNGLDKHGSGSKVVIQNMRSMEQLVTKCCQLCNVSPQPRILHTVEGKSIKKITEIADGQDVLIIQSGAMYKADSIPTALKQRRPTTPSEASMRSMDDGLFGSAGSPKQSAKKAGAGAGAGAGGDIFEKLTDKSTYTGMYANHNEKKVEHKNPEVEKGGGPSKNFDQAPPSKFGLQMDKPVAFTCWNGLDKFSKGSKVVVQNVRTMTQLVQKCCQLCNVNPHPTILHTPEGKPVKSLDQLVDGADYIVIQSGAKYKKDSLPAALVAKS